MPPCKINSFKKLLSKIAHKLKKNINFALLYETSFREALSVAIEEFI